ncbi:hypothetical protein HHL22_20470 [Hymenobacter sp. RP-2-7]|uniref:NUMOD4 domain-containing protein n=1 Tax=Hymenobacter polaris TaxID=2682546 RepID=A0A7Y0AHU2_9BACT|nr:NUMOD4 domain-containing protein [Hymenobacter polaris]NML67582.1 hypothetical protein [Hymenobacter polaris]
MEQHRILTPWLDTDLADIDGEEWRDIRGYEGAYQVSSYGRIKSLARHDRLGRFVRARIRRLSFHPQGFTTVGLRQDGLENSYAIMLLVGNAFLTKQHPDQIYMHRNKNQLDNRVANIQVGTWAESHSLDLALGKKTSRTPTLVAYQQQRAAQHLEQFGIRQQGQLSAKTCPVCLVAQPLTAYYKNHHRCKACYLQKLGIKSVGKLAASQALGEQGLRKCSKCKQIKPFADFGNSKRNAFGKQYACKACQKV